MQTVDGKVQVLKNTKDYWPIGSKLDHEALLELRAYSDCLIHGSNLAKEFGEITVKSLNNSAFKRLRRNLGKNPTLPLFVITRKKSVTHPMWNITSLDPKALACELYTRGYKQILIEGGPTLLASFLKENLIDQIFLTIAPKIFGNINSSTLTLVEGYLFPKKAIKNLSLLSVKKVGNELFLRYNLGN